MKDNEYRAWYEGSYWQIQEINFAGEVVTLYSKKEHSTETVSIDKVVFEQFTGKHDAKKWEYITEQERERWTQSGNMPSEWRGRKIFTGDIVKTRNGENAEVKYQAPSFGLDYHEQNVIGISMYNDSFWSELLVIGNVHENPELLK